MNYMVYEFTILYIAIITHIVLRLLLRAAVRPRGNRERAKTRVIHGSNKRHTQTCGDPVER